MEKICMLVVLHMFIPILSFSQSPLINILGKSIYKVTEGIRYKYDVYKRDNKEIIFLNYSDKGFIAYCLFLDDICVSCVSNRGDKSESYHVRSLYREYRKNRYYWNKKIAILGEYSSVGNYSIISNYLTYYCIRESHGIMLKRIIRCDNIPLNFIVINSTYTAN